MKYFEELYFRPWCKHNQNIAGVYSFCEECNPGAEKAEKLARRIAKTRFGSLILKKNVYEFLTQST